MCIRDSAVTDPLPTATERYRATRPFYRQLVEAGFLRRLIPQALGGDGTGASATAALAEELVAGDPGVALNLFSTGLGLGSATARTSSRASPSWRCGCRPPTSWARSATGSASSEPPSAGP